jgi:hypothetical protein
MCLEQFIEDLQAEFEEICWRDHPERVRAENILKLRNQTKSSESVLARHDLTAEELDHRITNLENLEAELPERIEIYVHVSDKKNAWEHALELDRIRGEIAVLRRRAESHARTREFEAARLENLREEIASLLRTRSS